jgi:RNA polymerase sigma factor (sigma-70 family)
LGWQFNCHPNGNAYKRLLEEKRSEMMSESVSKLTSDEELAGRAQQGCVESLDLLFRRFQTPVLHFLRRRGFSSDAEDLTQETLLRVCENLHQYNRRWPFSTWLFTIARRTSLNHRRRLRPTADARAAEAAYAFSPAPLENMVADENRRRIWDRAAEVLSEEQTTALWLHYVEHLPAREIGRVLGRSWPAVNVMLFRARKKLLPLLGEFVGKINDPRQRTKQVEVRRPERPVAVKLEAPHV